MIAARQVELDTTAEALLRSIIYFDIFNYPITAEEAQIFAPALLKKPCLSILESLVAEKKLFKHGNFYSIQNNPELNSRRLTGNQMAEKRLKTARRYSRLIASFPFVRAVLLSGSISKGFMDHASDIDYFIITSPKRLWIVRSALALFRRVFLFNSHKNLCTNYFIDTENLSIPDRNIFTATELCTLKPMYGQAAIDQFQKANLWAFDFLPQGKFNKAILNDGSFPIKHTIERLFSFNAMSRFNQWLMRRSSAFWKRKYVHAAGTPDFEIAFRTKEGVSKSHPRFFQKRALEQFDEKVRSFEILHQTDLTP